MTSSLLQQVLVLFILPVEGSTLPGVTGFRTIEDTQFMMDTAKRKEKGRCHWWWITWFRSRKRSY